MAVTAFQSLVFLRQQGFSWSKMASITKIPQTTVRRYTLGITRIPSIRVESVLQSYRRIAYNVLRVSGVNVSEARKFSGRSMPRIQQMIERLDLRREEIAFRHDITPQEVKDAQVMADMPYDEMLKDTP